MLVDLGRNDIGKISKIGTVQVEKYMEIERFSHVMHIGSTVTGVIRDDKDAVDAVDAILPAGTLSGAPKFRACQIIEELEQSKRGIYGGAIGYLDFAGNLDTCIAIRLVYKKNGEICIRSGAGIVADSVPEKEFEECCNKARAVRAGHQAGRGGTGMILLIDNYDSFSYNLYQLIGSVYPDIRVIRNDDCTVEEIEAMQPAALILSPGPGRPEDAGICIPAIRYFAGKIPILGVCLGHQAICEAFGGTVTYAKQLMHGKQKQIRQTMEKPDLCRHAGDIFWQRGIIRWRQRRKRFRRSCVVTAESEDGEVMAVEHRNDPIFGLQFHPESVMTPEGKKMIENFIKCVEKFN